jgi:hypothetical protein
MAKGRGSVTPFSISGKPGLNVDLEDPNNPLDYFEFSLQLNLLNR